MSETFKQLKINGQQVNVGSADRDGEGNIITSTYARQDGYYSTLGAGTAEQLISTVGIIDNDPYRFRSTAGNTSVSDGTAEIKMLKANTKQFNQLAPLITSSNYGFSAVTNSSVVGGIAKFTGTSSSATAYYASSSGFKSAKLIQGHKYYYCADIKLTSAVPANSVWLRFQWSTGSGLRDTYVNPNVTDFQRVGRIVTINSAVGSGYSPLRVRDSRSSGWDEIQVKNFQLFDLTAMGLDSITTVDEFTALYPEVYYDYNLGTLYNPSVSAIKSVGFNAFNPNTGYAHVIKGIDGQGENNGYRVAGTYNSLYITEAPSENPTIDGTLLTPESFTDDAGNTINRILPPYNGYVYVINPGSDFIMNLVWSGGRDEDTAEDNPYTEFTRELPVATYFPNDMKSAGEAYDELNKSKAITRIGAVDFGTLEWTAGTGTYSAIVTGIKQNTTNLLCSRFASDQLSLSGDVLTVTSSTPPVGVLYYELATYIEESIDPVLNLTYTECDWGTEEFLSTNSGIIAELPVGNVTYYMNNLRDKLQNLNPLTPEELAECLAELG